MKKVIIKFVIVAVAVFVQSLAYAYQGDQSKLDAHTVIAKANEAVFYAGEDAQCKVDLKMIKDDGRTSQWSFNILRLNTDNEGDQKYLVSFSKPVFMSQLSYLVWKRMNGADQRWLYFPNLNFINTITESQQRMPFMGAQFAFEDLTGREINADQYELLDYSTGHYLIKGTPINNKKTEFDHYYVWIREKDFIPVKIEFYDENNYLLRIFEVLEIEDINGHPTITRSIIKDLQQGGETLVKFSDVNYDTGISEKIFTGQYLRNPDRIFH
ncbi:MAG: outer membrane lipoprotein-sorting protein [Candidatus Omnitrophica bacterium]|nr:outer membrane lipoprotein-sorting protein [Candidatus Omnitrophota bacterium]